MLRGLTTKAGGESFLKDQTAFCLIPGDMNAVALLYGEGPAAFDREYNAAQFINFSNGAKVIHGDSSLIIMYCAGKGKRFSNTQYIIIPENSQCLYRK